MTISTELYPGVCAEPAAATPGFVLNGEEWRRTKGQADLSKSSSTEPGHLTVDEIGPKKFRVKFVPNKGFDGVEVYAALLGNGLVSHVSAGENSGHDLSHDFVVLQLVHQSVQNSGAHGLSTEIQLESSGTIQPRSYSVAFWVSSQNNQKPIQAVGGDLK